MEIKCTVEELIKMVSAKQTDTINIKRNTIKNAKEIIEKLNQAKSQ